MKMMMFFLGLLVASNSFAGSIEFNISGFGFGKTLKIKSQLKKHFKTCETTEKIGVQVVRLKRYRYECVPHTFDRSVCENQLVATWWESAVELWQEGRVLDGGYVDTHTSENEYIESAKKLLSNRYLNCGLQTK